MSTLYYPQTVSPLQSTLPSKGKGNTSVGNGRYVRVNSKCVARCARCDAANTKHAKTQKKETQTGILPLNNAPFQLLPDVCRSRQ